MSRPQHVGDVVTARSSSSSSSHGRRLAPASGAVAPAMLPPQQQQQQRVCANMPARPPENPALYPAVAAQRSAHPHSHSGARNSPLAAILAAGAAAAGAPEASVAAPIAEAAAQAQLQSSSSSPYAASSFDEVQRAHQAAAVAAAQATSMMQWHQWHWTQQQQAMHAAQQAHMAQQQMHHAASLHHVSNSAAAWSMPPPPGPAGPMLFAASIPSAIPLALSAQHSSSGVSHSMPVAFSAQQLMAQQSAATSAFLIPQHPLQHQLQLQQQQQQQQQLQPQSQQHSMPSHHLPVASAISMPHQASYEQYQRQLAALNAQRQAAEAEESAHREQLSRALQSSMDSAPSLNRRAASAESIAALPETIVTAAMLSSSSGSSSGSSSPCPCTICLAEPELGESVLSLPCTHVFHRGCLLTWLQLRNTCPCCRWELDTEDPVYNRGIRERRAARAAENAAAAAASASSRSQQQQQQPLQPATVSPLHAEELLDEDDSVSDDEQEDEEEEEDDEDLIDLEGSSLMDDEDASGAASAASGSGSGSGSGGGVSLSQQTSPEFAPLLTYHTLHHLQSLAAAEFSSLAMQARLQQQQQQQLIFYQQQLWQAQRNLQARLHPSVLAAAISTPILAAAPPSAPAASTRQAASVLPSSAHRGSIIAGARAPWARQAQRMASQVTVSPRFTCSLCRQERAGMESTAAPAASSSSSSPASPSSCALSCGHVYHVHCWTDHAIAQRSSAANAQVTCPECVQQQAEEAQSAEQDEQEEQPRPQQQQQQDQECLQPPLQYVVTDQPMAM